VILYNVRQRKILPSCSRIRLHYYATCNNEIHRIRDRCMPIGDFIAIGALFLIT